PNTHVGIEDHLGNCKGFKKHNELSRSPVSALTSVGFLLVAAVALGRDVPLACASAALSAGSFAWHSTGQQDTIHLDHFGCTLYAVALARAFLGSIGRLNERLLLLAFCITVAVGAGLGAPDDASYDAAFLAAVALLTSFVLTVATNYPVVINCAIPGVLGMAFHERTHNLSGVASCTGNLDDDAIADITHATWHCCAVILGMEAAFASANSLSPLSTGLLPLLVSLHWPSLGVYVLPATLVCGAIACIARERCTTSPDKAVYSTVPGTL
ncbi:MAG: hypothetical protein VW491_11660, partial [Gammaproteobacteria bacterium]